MAEPSSAQSDIMTTLLGDDIEVEHEEHAVEAVLSLDEVTIEIDQFDANQTDQEFDFIKSSGPTLSEVQDYHQPEEVELDKSDAPKDNVEFDLPQFNPLEEVAEPVHTGQGGLYSADENSENVSTLKDRTSKIRNNGIKWESKWILRQILYKYIKSFLPTSSNFSSNFLNTRKFVVSANIISSSIIIISLFNILVIIPFVAFFSCSLFANT